MEMGMVLLSTEEYNKLLLENFKSHNKSIQKEIKYEGLEKDYKELMEFAIRKCVIEYRIKNNTLEELLDFKSITSAIGIDDYKTLISYGIKHWQIEDVIKVMKEEQDGNE